MWEDTGPEQAWVEAIMARLSGAHALGDRGLEALQPRDSQAAEAQEADGSAEPWRRRTTARPAGGDPIGACLEAATRA